MAAADYCVVPGYRCRYTGGANELCAPCDFHRAMARRDIDGMQRALTEPEGDTRWPAGLKIQSVARRRDGSYRFVLVAHP